MTATLADSPPLHTDWYKRTVLETFELLNTSQSDGLSQSQAEIRLTKFGSNELVDRKHRAWPRILLAQLQSSLVLLLIGAALISIVLGETTDSIAVLAIVFLNTALGFWQDFSAEKSLTELKKLAVPEVTIKRDGESKTTAASKIVPGDLVALKTGCFVPADCRLVAQTDLMIDESALTGESLSIDKTTDAMGEPDLVLGDRANMVFAGTMVVKGHAMAAVVSTGMQTELGKIAGSLQAVRPEPTPLQTKLGQLSRSLAVIAVLVVGLVFAAGLVSGEPFKLMLLTALSMAVAIVPEGLPAVATVALSLGARAMFKRNALIRQLPAVETLGSVSVICSDKTGTLTQNKMAATFLDVFNHRLRVDQLSDVSGDLRTLLLAACLCNDAELVKDNPHGENNALAIGEPTERALVEVAAKLGLNQLELSTQLPRVAEVTFSSKRKRMTTIHELSHPWNSRFGNQFQHVAFCKGAVDRLLELASDVHIDGELHPMSCEFRDRILRSHDELADAGNRVLAVAVRPLKGRYDIEEVENNMAFVGLIALSDPPRPEAKAAVDLCRQAGIRPIMITGDHPLTALSIAKQIGIAQGSEVVTGVELSGMSAQKLREKVAYVSVFARVAPEDKLNIVEALQQRTEVVAMTGDGVNDAPALKQANVGVAMGNTGTDVSKQAAKVVLLDDNFATIVAAVEQGRTVYGNIRKFVKYAMSGNIGEVFVMLVGVISGMPLPLLPLQILWVNLVTDGLPGLALAVEPTEPGTMRRKPLSIDEPIFDRRMLLDLLWAGTLICAASLTTAHFYWNDNKSIDHWRTIVFTVLTLTQMANAFSCRSTTSILSSRLFQNYWLTAAVSSTFLLQLIVIYWPPAQAVFQTSPLTISELGGCLLASLGVFILIELKKRF